MTKTEIHPRIGDIISSPEFAYGWYKENPRIIYVDGKTVTRMVKRPLTEEEKRSYQTLYGCTPPKTMEENHAKWNHTRGVSEWLIIDIDYQEPSVNGLYIKAVELLPDGSPYADGELICFWTDENDVNKGVAIVKEFTIVRHMENIPL